MGGKNPYLKGAPPAPPKSDYDVTFVPHGVKVRVEKSKLPYGPTGLPGSLLDIALSHGVDIDHACGGVAACSTCHVYVKRGLETCNEAADEELDQLDNAPATTLQSRLACQCVPDGSQSVEVEIPGWNRNAVRE